LHIGLCFFQSAFWQSAEQYQTVEHREHFFEAGVSHFWQRLGEAAVVVVVDTMVNLWVV
jgi:hypothetical protein